MEPLIYCNNAASTWPKPPEVIDAVVKSLELPYFEAGRSMIPGLHNYPEMTRDALAPPALFECRGIVEGKSPRGDFTLVPA